MEVNDKELIILKEIASNHLPDQRKIAKNASFSLGLVNLIIKSLISKGLVKTKRLNKKRIQYIMTAQGFTEQAKKSYRYTVETIGQLKLINEKIQVLITECYNKGIREIRILAGKELTMMIEMAINSSNLDGLKYRVITNAADNQSGSGSILFTSGMKPNGPNSDVIDVIGYLSSYGVYASSKTERNMPHA
jgi:hypothetical protein